MSPDPVAILGRILRGYCRWQRPDEIVAALRELGGGTVDETTQGLFMERCYQHDAAQKHPPPTDYRESLLKAIVRAVDRDGNETDAALMDALTELLCSAKMQEQSTWGYKTIFYQLRSGEASDIEHISFRVSKNMLEGSTGCYQWEAGYALGQFILSHPELFKGKSCLELGCGSGLVGICLHRVQAGSVLLTDGNADAISNCKHNVAVNCGPNGALPKGLEIVELAWGSALPARWAPDVLVGADLLYDSSSFPALVRTVANVVRRGEGRNVCCFLASCERNPETIAAFRREAAAGGLHIKAIGCECHTSRVAFLDVLASVKETVILHRITCA